MEPARWTASLPAGAALLAGCAAAPAPGRGEGRDKLVICHEGKKTLTIAEPAWDAHRRHGDSVGA